MAEFEKWKNPPKANFVISKRATPDDAVRPLTCIGLHDAAGHESCLVYATSAAISTLAHFLDSGENM